MVTTNLSLPLRSKEANHGSILGTDDAGIIAQFEKWWDKYKVSLKELDAEVESLQRR